MCARAPPLSASDATLNSRGASRYSDRRQPQSPIDRCDHRSTISKSLAYPFCAYIHEGWASMTTSAIRPPSLGPWLAHQLAEKIISQSLPGGERLLETELASEYGLSRAPVREALR